MSDLTPPTSENNSAAPAAGSPLTDRAEEVTRNGNPQPGPAAEAQGEQKLASEMQRAEQIVDGVAQRVVALSNTVWGKGLLTLAAHAREAAQDFWAEVQQVRRRQKP